MAVFQKSAKIIFIFIILAVVLGVTILLGKQASTTFFAKASTCPVLLEPSDKAPKATQVTGNSGVVIWETNDVTQGRVEYGTSPTSLSFSAPESTSGKTHSVPLTLLTPNTRYHYIITIGDSKCDATGVCKGDQCVPFFFDTQGITPQQEIKATIQVPTPTIVLTASPTVSITSTASPTSAINLPKPTGASTSSTLSAFCVQIEAFMGARSTDTSKWSTAKKYDLNNDGIINVADIFACKASGK